MNVRNPAAAEILILQPGSTDGCASPSHVEGRTLVHLLTASILEVGAIMKFGSEYPLPCALAGRLFGTRKSSLRPEKCRSSIGSPPVSPLTPGGEVLRRFDSAGRGFDQRSSGMEMGAPGRPGFASSTWS